MAWELWTAPFDLCCPKTGWAKRLDTPLCATGGNSKMTNLQMMHTSCESKLSDHRKRSTYKVTTETHNLEGVM